jgi:hypothetical protein
MTKIDGLGDLIQVYAEVNKLAQSGVRFARRPFSGAERIEFKYNKNLGHSSFDGLYIGHDRFGDINLCANKCWQYIGVRRNVKKFSLWVKLDWNAHENHLLNARREAREGASFQDLCNSRSASSPNLQQ